MSETTPSSILVPTRLPATRGIAWFFEPWRAAFHKPLLWLLLGGMAGLWLAAFAFVTAFFLGQPLLALAELPIAGAVAAWAAWRFVTRDAAPRQPWRTWAPGALQAVLRRAAIDIVVALPVWHLMGRTPFVLPALAVLLLMPHCGVELARHATGAATSAGACLVDARARRHMTAVNLLLAAALCMVLLPGWFFETGLLAALENSAVLLLGFDPAFWERIPILPALENASAPLLFPLALGFLTFIACLALTLWTLLAQVLAALLNLPLRTALAHAARTMHRNMPACAAYICTLALFCAASSAAAILLLRGFFILAPNVAFAIASKYSISVLLPLLCLGIFLIFFALTLEMQFAPWLMLRDMFGAAAMQPVPAAPTENVAAMMGLAGPETLPSAAWRERPARVPLLHGLGWISGAWCQVFHKPLLWLPAGAALAVHGIFWLVIFTRGAVLPLLEFQVLLALGVMPFYTNITAIFMQRAINGPADAFIGPPPPAPLQRARMVRFLPWAIAYNAVVFGGVGWIFWHHDFTLIALPLLCVLTMLCIDWLGLLSGFYRNMDAIILSQRAAQHSLVLTLMLLIILAATVYFVVPLLPQPLHQYRTAILCALCLALATWALLAQILAALLNWPLGTALKRAAAALWRNAGACALYMLLLSGAMYAATFIARSTGILGTLPIIGATWLLLFLFIISAMLPPWFMARDIFKKESDETPKTHA